MRPFVVGTAGHIDHGKSALVQALTGIDPDRLPEEKRRGITIELGFAHATLAPGVEAAFVDVPGHERFVKSMVAGAHGVDVVLLVVALDEGVMPQTREHADIARLLAVPRAVIALTKDDLAPGLDPAWPALVIEDVRALGEPFASAPLVRVSARTGAGLDELKATLARAASELPEKATQLPPQLPIDRAFTLKGHGTVVTGTLVAGALGVGDALELATPAPREVKVIGGLRARSLQTHGRPVTRAVAGQRVAVNLPGIEVSAVARGSVLSAEGTGLARSGALFDVELELVPHAPPLKNRARATLHLGTAQALATIDLLGLAQLSPGEKTIAQLRLDRALVAVREQRFVLRGYRALAQGGRTLGGGRILVASRRRRRASERETVARLAGELPEVVRALALEAGVEGLDPARLALQLASPVEKVPGLGRVGAKLFDPAALDALTERLRALARSHPGVPREEARASLGPRVALEAFAHALGKLGAEFVVGDTIELASQRASALEERVAAALEKGGLTPPTVSELARSLGVDAYAAGGALRALARRGQAIRLTDELFIGSPAANEFRRRATAALQERGELTTLELKAIAGTSRKFLIPLCEWLDREHVTLRVGEKRTLRRSG